MAEDENNLDSAAEQSAEKAETPNETFRSVEDSIAITRTKGAYQPDNRRYTQALKEKKVPQRVIAAQMNQVDPLTEDDIDDETLIAPSRQIIGTAYRDTAKPDQLPTFRPVVAESSAGDDTLSLASTDNRNVQTVSFKVKGIQWRAGFADTLANTPLGHAIHPSSLPGYKDEIPESLKKAGIVIRPVNPRLRVVLNQLLPPDFRKKVSQQRKKTDRMKLLAIFYLPGTPSSHVGFIHEFVGSKSNYRFYLYIQTSVGKAPVAILDEVLKTLEAGLPEGEKASDLDEYEVAEEEQDVPEVEFDFSGEVQQAVKQAGDTLNNSIVVYGAKQANRVVRDWSLELIRVIDRVIARFIRGVTWVLIQLANSPLIRALAASTQFLSKIFVQFIWGLNKVLLGVARSPITKAIFENIVRVFKILGRLFLLIWFGIQWVFQSAIAIGAYFANAIRPGSMNMPANSIQFPSFGQGMFGGQKSGSTSRNSKKVQDANAKKNQLTANKTTAAKRRLPPPKPVKKQGAIPALPGTTPVGPRNKNLPPPPGLKPGEPLSAEAKAAKQRELGYFEDQAF